MPDLLLNLNHRSFACAQDDVPFQDGTDPNGAMKSGKMATAFVMTVPVTCGSPAPVMRHSEQSEESMPDMLLNLNHRSFACAQDDVPF